MLVIRQKNGIIKDKYLTRTTSEYGIGLVEAVIALGVAIVVITALVSLTVFTLRTSTRSKLLFEGSKLANSELELVRSLRDTDGWTSFTADVDGCTNITLPTSACHINRSAGGTVTIPIGVGGGAWTQNINQADELGILFYTTDPLEGNAPLDGDETVVRIAVRVHWRDGSQGATPVFRYSHIYTDVSNWRTN